MKNLTTENIAEKWLNTFARDADPKKLDADVREKGCFLWHIFSYHYVECLSGKDAEKAFEELEYDEAYIFTESVYGGNKIDKFGITKKILPSDLRQKGDSYVTDKNLDWTYVCTHEDGWLGPYFCRRKLFDWELQ